MKIISRTFLKPEYLLPLIYLILIIFAVEWRDYLIRKDQMRLLAGLLIEQKYLWADLLIVLLTTPARFFFTTFRQLGVSYYPPFPASSAGSRFLYIDDIYDKLTPFDISVWIYFVVTPILYFILGYLIRLGFISVSTILKVMQNKRPRQEPKKANSEKNFISCLQKIEYLLPTSYLVVAITILVYQHTPLYIEPEGMFAISTSNLILAYLSFPSYPMWLLLDSLFGNALATKLMPIIRLGGSFETPMVNLLISALGYFLIGYLISRIWRKIQHV